jgi:hypothetical protein
MDYESSHEEPSDNLDSEVNESFDQNMSTFKDDETNQNEDIFENILENSDLNEEPEVEIEMNTSYPNEAYADLMTLVIKHNLSNATGNAIIKFFNKHANLSTSPLPKSIEKGREFMDKMNVPNLTYNKTCVIKYNEEEYYLHHRSLINCVKHILSIPDILKYFMQKFECLKVIINFSLRFMLFYIDLILYIINK